MTGTTGAAMKNPISPPRTTAVEEGVEKIEEAGETGESCTFFKLFKL